MAVALIVVLYACRAGASQTLQRLVASGQRFDGDVLWIWHNGPQPAAADFADAEAAAFLDRLEALGFALRFVDAPQNFPLAWIYDAFFSRVQADKYVVLDHDSDLSVGYLRELKARPTVYVDVPLILSGGRPRSPQVSGRARTGPFTQGDALFAVGSGVVLARAAVEEIRQRCGSVFDPHFALYGVDESLFFRIRALGRNPAVAVMPGFEHALSRLADEAPATRQMRARERSIARALCLRHYPSPDRLRGALRSLWRSLRGREAGFSVKPFLAALWRGEHPRCGAEMLLAFRAVCADLDQNAGRSAR